MDVLLTTESKSGNKNTQIYIFWGHGQTLGTVLQYCSFKCYLVLLQMQQYKIVLLHLLKLFVLWEAYGKHNALIQHTKLHHCMFFNNTF